jgi:hypothetical protein
LIEVDPGLAGCHCVPDQPVAPRHFDHMLTLRLRQAVRLPDVEKPSRPEVRPGPTCFGHGVVGDARTSSFSFS